MSVYNNTKFQININPEPTVNRGHDGASYYDNYHVINLETECIDSRCEDLFTALRVADYMEFVLINNKWRYEPTPDFGANFLQALSQASEEDDEDESGPALN